MKSRKLILALCLSASAWAQTLPQKQQVTTPVSAKPIASQMQASKPLSTQKPAAAQPSRPVATSSSEVVKRTKRSPSKPGSGKHIRKEIVVRRFSSANHASVVNGQPAVIHRGGRRDPFVSPIVERVRNSVVCTGSGKQCLIVGELSLHGVVRSPSGFIAVVMNGDHTYFLREHDPLADGAVERITKDTIILRERFSDPLGRPLSREVTKKLGVPAV